MATVAARVKKDRDKEKEKETGRMSTDSTAPSSEVSTSDMKKILDAITVLNKKIDDSTATLEKKMEDSVASLDIKMDKKIDNLGQQVDKKMEAMKEDLKKEFRKEIQNVKEVVNTLSGEFKETQGQVKKLEIKSESIIKDMEYNLDAIALVEMREKEFILRLRGVPEKSDENTREYIVSALAQYLQIEEEDLDSEIDKIFRVNSRYAREKKVPRDILIYFVRKVTKEQILKKHYSDRLNIAGKDIIVLKEVPLRILRKRKEYSFLTDKLKQNNILFRWERIEGVSFTFKEQRFKITSVLKAKAFIEKYMTDMSDASKVLEEMKETFKDKEKSEDLSEMGASGVDLKKNF